ncbi:metabolite traffic protein EboE [Cellulomonas carbonis]|uniref:Xylose isomerase n=1 Tax=Cellulomonas carbonis T26 TaxID=947969 RepID=A0A0A0BTE5_9CELL|nr:metabolite traffic protein EboE [Cellulomonas carbonis]KGM10444.1 xylose isomerase [Cellulomonas carbonis T26]GGC13494.1 xylose isomerase [Cellulomonas carbonis]
MRLHHPDGTRVHLAYGTNVHPAEDVDGLLAQLDRYGRRVREHLGVATLGLGLWLPARAAAALAADPAGTDRLRSALRAAGLEVVTLNAFPYAAFHAPRVKHAVYRPDWSTPERLAYTLDCAAVLTRLLPDDADRGSISTLPLGWRAGWDRTRHRAAEDALHRLTDGLRALADRTGRVVRVGLEPEPGCVLETSTDAVARLGGLDAEHLGVCLDLCHVATEFEDPAAAVERVRDAGIPVVKVQVSAALHAADPTVARTALSAFAEDRFLHQVRERAGRRDAAVVRRDDLPDALGADGLPAVGPWRVHVHVPVHHEPEPPLTSTRDALLRGLAAVLGSPAALTDHLEVETYTWSVLPDHLRPADDDGLVAGLAAELAWTRDRLADLAVAPSTLEHA